MYRFLSEVEILTEERKMTKKELAEKIGTSASYITQLYRGNKLLNLATIAKFQKALGITFNISTVSASESSADDRESEQTVEPEGFWYYKKFNKQQQDSFPPCLQGETDPISANTAA